MRSVCTVILDMTTQATGQHYRGGFYEGFIGAFSVHSDAGWRLGPCDLGISLGTMDMTTQATGQHYRGGFYATWE